MIKIETCERKVISRLGVYIRPAKLLVAHFPAVGLLRAVAFSLSPGALPNEMSFAARDCRFRIEPTWVAMSICHQLGRVSRLWHDGRNLARIPQHGSCLPDGTNVQKRKEPPIKIQSNKAYTGPTSVSSKKRTRRREASNSISLPFIEPSSVVR
jgi:hypothetical protein